MSCSDITVQILGDAADIMVYVTQASASADKAAASAVSAAASASQAQAAINAPYRIKISDEGQAVGATLNELDFHGDNVVVKQTSPGIYVIEILSQKIPKIEDIAGLKDIIDRINAEKIDEVIGDVDGARKTITLKMLSNNQVIKTSTINLSPMFGKVAPSMLEIYSGFSAFNTPDEATIKGGTRAISDYIFGLNIKLSRIDSTQKYMFVWVPSEFVPIKGFKFSGTFVDVWQSTAMSVNGVPGMVYVSDNPTTAQSVMFEVEQ